MNSYAPIKCPISYDLERPITTPNHPHFLRYNGYIISPFLSP